MTSTVPPVPRVGRAVWSFWSRPYDAFYRSSWTDEMFHLLSWVLSFRTGSCHFDETALVTDTPGARLLVDRLGLPFDQVSTSLDSISVEHQHCWALGKLHAYRQQEHPFAHLDSDVYLWKPLPDSLLTADVFVQNPEYAPASDTTYYKPTAFINRVREIDGWLPDDFDGYVAAGGETAFCTGIVGGTAVRHLGEYADRAIRMFEETSNQRLWSKDQTVQDMVLIEQFYLAAYCLDATNALIDRPRVRYLFESQAQSFDDQAARDAGYSHLIAGAKRDPELRRLVQDRVRKDYPSDYEHCVGIARRDRA